MDPMPAPAHAKPRTEGLIAAWLCLIIAGVTTVTFNVWNAVFSGMALLPGIMEGIAPVALAMVVSHLVATCRAGKFLRTVTFAVMVGAMVLSVHATGVVVRPAAGPLWWLFGAVIDTAALVALQVLLSIKARAAQEAAESAAAEAHAADERTALRAELETACAALETARDAAADAERRALAAEQKAEAAARKLAAQKPRRTRTAAPGTAGRTAPRAARDTEVPDDFDARTEALGIWLENPGISGRELAEKVGKKERWGQLRKNEFATASKGQETP